MGTKSGGVTALAFDLGATSGRAILGRLRAGRLEIREIHRFPNEPVRYNGGLHWDAPRLWLEMQAGLRLAAQTEDEIASVGVDAWGVDYALIGEDGALLDNPYHYRDARTAGMMERACSAVTAARIYGDTGIQFMPINTLYQLYAAAQRTPRLLEGAEALLNMPDLFHFWLTGVKRSEYTIASTTQCLHRQTREWARPLLGELGIPTHFLQPIVHPGAELGGLREELVSCGSLRNTRVIVPACHDTGSAVAAVMSGGRTAFLSSGTWSLLGTEVPEALAGEASLRLNFTNEGSVGGAVRLLKNITGMWLLEQCLKSWEAAGRKYAYAELLEAAAAAPPLRSLLDPDEAAFTAPEDMPTAIAAYCARTGQPAPDSPGAFTRAILESLALKYRLTLEQLAAITGSSFDTLRVMGGGSRNALLNQFTADATGCSVLAGPVEATALGNIAVQLTGAGAIASIAEARELIGRSFPATPYEPSGSGAWEHGYRQFRSLCS